MTNIRKCKYKFHRNPNSNLQIKVNSQSENLSKRGIEKVFCQKKCMVEIVHMNNKNMTHFLLKIAIFKWNSQIISFFSNLHPIEF